MNSKELIRRIIEHDSPPRLGFDFLGNNPTDILHVPSAVLNRPDGMPVEIWGRDPALVSRVPGFGGEVKMTAMGNIFGRLTPKTMGECIRGALQDSWDLLEYFLFPVINEDKDREFEKLQWNRSDKFVITWIPISVWSPLRDTRLCDQALMDTVAETENVKRFLEKTTDLAVEIIRRAHKNGVNAAMFGEDIGTQNDLFYSPETFRSLFKPFYKKLADELHSRGMKYIVHCCGNIHKVMHDFIDAGVDVFQFDQIELIGSKNLADEFANKTAFYCPVDIQKIMATGDEKYIREGAMDMISHFKKHGGSLIVKDYPSWEDIDVLPEWQQWARDVIIANADL